MPFKATAKFPGAIAAVTDFGNLQDFIAGTTKPTLAATITNAVTSFSVATGTGATLPTDNFSITVESEEMFVVTRTTDALSGITRGINGTTAAAHSIGIGVNHFITANLINQLAAEVNALENYCTVYFSGSSSAFFMSSTPVVSGGAAADSCTVTVAAKSVARKYVVNGMVTWNSGTHGLGGTVLLDGVLAFPTQNSGGFNPIATGDRDYLLTWAGIIISVPGDNATHTIALAIQSQTSSSAITLHDRWIVAQQVA